MKDNTEIINQQLIDFFYTKIDDNDIDIQEKYYNALQNLIDAVIKIRYKRFPNNLIKIEELDHYLQKGIDTICLKKDEKLLDVLTKNILLRIHNSISIPCNLTFDDLYNDIIDIYHSYSYTSIFPKDLVSKLYSKILNTIEENFYTLEKDIIIKSLCDSLSITPKKEVQIIKGRKTRELTKIVANREYDRIKTNQSELVSKAKDKRLEITSLKELKKEKITISDDDFAYLEQSFANGSLKEESITNLLSCTSKLAKRIFKKYTQIWQDYLDNIFLTNVTIDLELYRSRHKIGFNYNNFVIVKDINNLNNTKDLIVRMPLALKKKILANKKLYSEVSYLLPLVSFFPEFGLDEYIKILQNYPKVKEEILRKKQIKGTYISDIEWIETHLDDLINYSLGYAYQNEVEYALIGKEVYEKNPLRASKYAEFYLEMVTRKRSYVPIIKGNFRGYKYQTGNFNDSRRLLIGLDCEDSCIDLFHDKGSITYCKVLLDKDADVVMIYDDKNKFYARSLIFRKGNFLLLAPLRNKKSSHENTLFDYELMEHIALSLFKEAILKNDNIDFIFMTESMFDDDILKKRYVTIDDERFLDSFPHADLQSRVHVLKQKIGCKNVDFQAPIKEEYIMERAKISDKPSVEDIMRIDALAKISNSDEDKQVMPKDLSNYLACYKGEDWYILVNKDGSLCECLVPDIDSRSIIEFTNFREKLREQNDSLDKPYML